VPGAPQPASIRSSPPSGKKAKKEIDELLASSGLYYKIMLQGKSNRLYYNRINSKIASIFPLSSGFLSATSIVN